MRLGLLVFVLPLMTLGCGDAVQGAANEDIPGELGDGEDPRASVKVFAPTDVDIMGVEYTLNCTAPSAPVRLNGNLEVSDSERSKSDAVVWQAFMDVPVGPCTLQVRARDGDGEVVCTASQPVQIESGVAAEVNLVLTCAL